MSDEKAKTILAKVVGKGNEEEKYKGKMDVIPGTMVQDVKKKIVEKLGAQLSVPPSRLSIMKEGKELTGKVYEKVSNGDELEVIPKTDIATCHKPLSFYFIALRGEKRWGY